MKLVLTMFSASSLRSQSGPVGSLVAAAGVPQVVDRQEQEGPAGQGAGPGLQGQQDLPAHRQDH